MPLAAAVKVNLIEGRDLAARDHTGEEIGSKITNKGGKSDPYCVISVKSGKSHAKSKHCVQTLHPIWNQIFTLDLKNRKDTVVIQVFDKDLVGKGLISKNLLMEDDPMGFVEIPMEKFHKNKEETEWYKLEDVESGVIRVGFMLKKRRKNSKDSEDFAESDNGNVSNEEDEADDDY